MTSWQKAIKYVAIAFAVFLVVSIVGGALGALGFVTGIFSNDNVLDEARIYDISEDFLCLDLDVGAADISIIEGNEFQLESNIRNLDAHVFNNTLVIEELKNELSAGFFNKSNGARVILQIPADFVFDKVELSTGAGRLVAENIATDTLSLELGAGQAKFENLIANKRAEIEGGTGQIAINSGSLTNLNMEMGVGEARIKSEILGRSFIETGIGAVNITLIGASEDYEISIEKGISGVKIDGLALRGSQLDAQVYGNGENQIFVESGIGGINISLE